MGQIDSLPKLSYAQSSPLQVSQFIESYNGDNYHLIEQLIKDGIKTAFTLHNTINDLLNLVGCMGRFTVLKKQQQKDLSRLYLWTKNTVKKSESKLTNLSLGTYKTIPTFKDAFDFENMISRGGFYALNARMGTGKTQFVGKPFCEASRKLGYTPIVIAHRVALIGELSAKTNTVHYEAVKLDESTDIKNGLAACVNSLANRKIQSAINKTNGKYTLFLDEYAQTLYNFDSSTFKKAEASEALHKFKNLIANAQAVIIADADMNDYSRDIARSIRKQEPESYFVDKDNSHVSVNISLQHGKGYDNVDLLFGQIAEHLLQGKKAVFYSNRNKICQALNDFIHMHYQDKKTLLICSHTEHDAKAKTFKAKAESEAKNYDLIIISPTITSGVSVVDDDFKTAFSVFDASTLTHLEAIQQIHRFRCVTDHHMVLMTKGVSINRASFTLEQTQAELNYNDDELSLKSYIDRLNKRIKDDKRLSQENFCQFIISRLTDLGYSLTVHDDIKSQLAFDVESQIKVINDAERNRILNAVKPTYAEYNELKQKDSLDEIEQYQVLNFDICQAFNLPQNRLLTGELLDVYGDKGRGVSAIRRNAIVFDGIDVDFMEGNEIRNNIPLNKRRFPRHVKDIGNKYLSAIFGKEITIANLVNLSDPLTFRNSELGDFATLAENTAPIGVITGLLSSKRVKRDFNNKEKEFYKATPVDPKGRARLAKEFFLRLGVKWVKVGRSVSITDGVTNDEIVYGVDIPTLMTAYELLGYQSDKTKELKRLHDEKLTALNGVKSDIDKSIDELSEKELSTLEMFVNAIISEYDQVERGSYAYSCPECYTPTNNYTCSCCGSRRVIPLINIHAVSFDKIKEDIFNALKFNVIEI